MSEDPSTHASAVEQTSEGELSKISPQDDDTQKAVMSDPTSAETLQNGSHSEQGIQQELDNSLIANDTEPGAVATAATPSTEEDPSSPGVADNVTRYSLDEPPRDDEMRISRSDEKEAGWTSGANDEIGSAEPVATGQDGREKEEEERDKGGEGVEPTAGVKEGGGGGGEGEKEEQWLDVLGGGELMKKVCVCVQFMCRTVFRLYSSNSPSLSLPSLFPSLLLSVE